MLGMAVWDVAVRPAREQFGYWREVICEAFVPLAPAPLRPVEGFRSRVETRPYNRIVRARIASQPQRTSHGIREVARTDGAYVFVNLQIAGTCAAEQGGRRSLVRPGQFTVVDTTEPYRFEFDGPWRMVSYRLPHDILGGCLEALRRQTADCRPNEGAGAVVAAVMSSMWRLDGSARAAVTSDVEHALVAALSAATAERGGVGIDRRGALRAEVPRRIRQPLLDLALDLGPHAARRRQRGWRDVRRDGPPPTARTRRHAARGPRLTGDGHRGRRLRGVRRAFVVQPRLPPRVRAQPDRGPPRGRCTTWTVDAHGLNGHASAPGPPWAP